MSVLPKRGKSSVTIAVIAIIALAILAAAAHIWISKWRSDRPVARIYQNGKLWREFTLSRDEDIIMNGNIVRVRGGKIGMTEADCPDKVCVKTGFVSGGVPIICLPNRVEVRVVNGKSDYDGITG